MAKTKALISFAVTAKLICIFVFTYAKCWFSHNATQCHMSGVMRKPAFCICENKGTEQLYSNCAADQRLCLRYLIVKYLYSIIPNFKPLAIFCGCTARFVSDLVGNPEDRFSHDAAHILYMLSASFVNCIELPVYFCFHHC